MAHKYTFEAAEDKLATAACNLITNHHREVLAKFGPTQLIDVAELICFPGMRERGVDCLKTYMKEGLLDIYDVLRIAEDSEYRWDLLGWAYYEIMLLGSSSWPKSESDNGDRQRLTMEQRRNLYRGSLRLQELWHDIARNGVPFSHVCGLERPQEECAGLEIWREEASKVSIQLSHLGKSSDIFKGLELMECALEDRFLYSCLLPARRNVGIMRLTLRLDLWRLFTEDDVNEPKRVISRMFW
jgi:hypothetical protein